MPEDLSQNIAPQPEIKEEITSLGITPPSGKSKKLKISLGILGLVFILASIPAAVYLVKQRQEMRSAACRNEGDCVSWQIIACGNGTWKGRVHKKGTSSWQEEELIIDDDGCHQSPHFDYNFNLSDGDWVEWELDKNGNLFGSKEYQVWNCPVPTPTPTPTPTPKPLTCISLGGEPNPSGLSPGDEITLTCTGSSDPTISIDHFEFRVSPDSGTPVIQPSVSASKANDEYQGQTVYTIPDYGCYKVECRACTSSDSSECTQWGQAQ